MISLPKINGTVGAILKGVIAVATGPAKIEGLKADIAETKLHVKELHKAMDRLTGEVREIKGYVKGYVEGHSNPDSP